MAHGDSDIAEGVDDGLFVAGEGIGHFLIGGDVIGISFAGVFAAICRLSGHKWMMPQGGQ